MIDDGSSLVWVVVLQLVLLRLFLNDRGGARDARHRHRLLTGAAGHDSECCRWFHLVCVDRRLGDGLKDRLVGCRLLRQQVPLLEESHGKLRLSKLKTE